MDVGTEINVTICLKSMARQTLGYSLFRVQLGREILRIEFDIANHD
jgi:hypothetical protein